MKHISCEAIVAYALAEVDQITLSDLSYMAYRLREKFPDTIVSINKIEQEENIWSNPLFNATGHPDDPVISRAEGITPGWFCSETLDVVFCDIEPAATKYLKKLARTIKKRKEAEGKVKAMPPYDVDRLEKLCMKNPNVLHMSRHVLITGTMMHGINNVQPFVVLLHVAVKRPDRITNYEYSFEREMDDYTHRCHLAGVPIISFKVGPVDTISYSTASGRMYYADRYRGVQEIK